MSSAYVAKWLKDGQPFTDDYTGVHHEVKEYVIQEIAKKYGLTVLVETGTSHGAMVLAQQPHFEQIYTIELFDEAYEIATSRYGHFDNIEFIKGDSSVELVKVLKKLPGTALFYLDAHYSGPGTARGDIDTPVIRELEILKASEWGSVIIVDDARCFAGEEYHTEQFKDYPSLAWIEEFVHENYPDYGVTRWADAFIVAPV